MLTHQIFDPNDTELKTNNPVPSGHQ